MAVTNVTAVTGPARRTQLLDAADAVVMRDGPDASMNEIAAAAGITKPILYRHFGDKGGLYRALADRHIEDLLVRLRTALATRGGRRTRVLATVEAYLAAIEERPQVYRFLVHRAGVEEPQVHGQVTSFQRRLADELARGISAELGLGAGEQARAQAWAHGIIGMVQLAGDWWLEERRTPRATLAIQLTDLLWGAYAKAPRARR